RRSDASRGQSPQRVPSARERAWLRLRGSRDPGDRGSFPTRRSSDLRFMSFPVLSKPRLPKPLRTPMGVTLRSPCCFQGAALLTKDRTRTRLKSSHGTSSHGVDWPRKKLERRPGARERAELPLRAAKI